jgi:hypothetical protein
VSVRSRTAAWLLLSGAIACTNRYDALEAAASTGLAGAAASGGLGGSGAGGAASSSSGAAGGAGGIGIEPIDAGSDATAPLTPVYASSVDHLYRFDPATNQLTDVGVFAGCVGDVRDLAMSKDGKLYAGGYGGFYEVDALTATCSEISGNPMPAGMAFVPPGTVDPVAEVLVGGDDGHFFRIDVVAGTLSPLGDLPMPVIISGDLTAIGDTIYMTSAAPACIDCLAQVEPASGGYLSIGPVGYEQIYGVASQGTKIFGFTGDGVVLSIDPVTGQGTDLGVEGGPSDLRGGAP